MHTSKLSIGALMAAGLTGLLATHATVAGAQTPSPPTTDVQAKAETRPGPLDLIVYFRAGGSDIDTASNTSLDELAVWLREDRGRTVFIEVHPEATAAASFDAKLGADRMDSARRYLVAHGAMDGQIRIVPHGSKTTARPGDLSSRTVFISTSGAGIGADDTPTPAEAVPAEPVYTPPVVRTDDDPSDDHLLTPFGMSVALGGGVVNFFDSDARNLTSPGGSWEARLTVGTRTPLAFEAAYVGSAQNIEALGLDNDAVLLGTMIEGDARLNLSSRAVQPYLFGGIGYTQYDVTNADFNTSSVDEQEHMGHIPVGAGVGWQYGGFLLDVRGTLRAAFSDGLKQEGETDTEVIPDESESVGRAELDTWNLTGRVGFEF